MIFTYRQNAFTIFSLVFLLAITVRAKSIHSRIIDSEQHSQNIHQQHRQIEVLQSVTEANVQVTNQDTTSRTTLDDSTNHSEQPETLANQQNEIEHGQDLQPSDAKPENITRNQRTIGDLSNPEAMMENFRKKLKFARNHLEEMSQEPNKVLDPKIYIYDPNIVIPVDRTPKFQLENSFETAKLSDVKPALEKIEDQTLNDEPREKKIISLPTNEKQSNVESADSIKEETTGKLQGTTEMKEDTAVKHSVPSKPESSNKQQCTATQPSGRALGSEEPKQEDVGNLIHMRGQINKLRSIMQVLKEHQIKQKLPVDFMKNRTLTKEEQEELGVLVKKMKEEGFISTVPLDPSKAFGRSQSFSLDEINNENSEKLNQDVNRLKEVITDLVKRTQVEKINEENLGKLQLQLETQKVEIENLRHLVDKLLPPIKVLTTSESKLIMHPTQMNAERIRLDEELKQLQDILTDLMAKRNKDKTLLRTTQTTEPNSNARENFDDNVKDPVNEVKVNEKVIKGKTDEELEALVKIFHSLAHPAASREGKSMETKIDQLERELKELDNRNLRTRQEMLLEKLERDIKELKDTKIVPEKADNIQAKIEKLEKDIKMHHGPKKISTVEDKIANLEKQIKLMAQPQSRVLDTNDNIEKELSKLQSEIDKLSQRQDSFPLLDHVSTAPLQDRVQNILKQMLLNSDGSHAGKITSSPYPPSAVPSVPVLPVKSTEHTNPAYPHIFQLPFCLQKNHQYPVKPSTNEEQYSDTQPEQFNVEQHSYPSKLTGTKGHHPLIYKPHSTIDKYNKYDMDSGENFVYNKPQSTETKPQINEKYEQPSHTDTHDDKYQYRTTNNAKLTDDNFPFFKSEDFLNDNMANKPNMNIDEEITRLNDILRMLNEKISKMSDEKNTGHTKLRKKRSVEQHSQDNSIENMQRRLAVLKELVEKYQDHTERKSNPEADSTEIEENSARTAYDYGDNYYESQEKPKLPGYKMKKVQKFDKLFIKIVKFILHKLHISAPYIVESLFDGEPVEYVYEGEEGYGGYDNDYRSAKTENQVKYRSGEYGNVVQNALGGFGGGGIPGFNGLLGIIPTILFKLLSNFSSFLNILKRNNFFKNFLVPGVLILLVDGIMATLIWWFSPQDDTNNLISLADTLYSRNTDTSLLKPNFNNPQVL